MNPRIGKPILRIIAGLSASLLLVLLMVTVAAAVCRPKPAVPDTSGWQTGMVFFSVGDSWESVAVRSITSLRNVALSDTTPSHCGIILMEPSGPALVHASTVAKKVVKETPEEYITKNGSYMIYSRAMPDRVDTVLLREHIEELLARDYPFDFDFDHSDGKALYCTELVVTLYELSGCNSLSPLREQHYIYPQDILNMLSDSNQ